MGFADPVHDRMPVCGVLAGDRTTRYEQYIGSRNFGEGRIDAEVHQVVLVVENSRALGAEDDFRVGQEAGQVGEHRIGAHRVQRSESLAMIT